MDHSKRAAALERLSGTRPEYYYLLAAGIIQFLFITCSAVVYRYIDNYALIPCMLFLGAAFTRKVPLSHQRNLWLGLVMVVWFMVIQAHNAADWVDVPAVGFFLTPYLMCYPFAQLTQDGEEQKGLKMIAKVYLAAALVMVLYAILMLLDWMPAFTSSEAYWDGARLRAMWHPNICASVLMIGIAFSLGFGFQARKRSHKILLFVIAAVLFVTCALTNSRTSILMTCVLIGGILFCRIWDGGWKRFLVGAAAALVVLVGLFVAATNIYEFHSEMLVARYAAQVAAIQESEAAAEVEGSSEAADPAQTEAAVSVEDLPVRVNEETGEVTLKGINGQGSLANDFWTFNGRTAIWKAAYYAIMTERSVRLWGTPDTGALITPYNSFMVGHSHNSWVEVLLALGVPGLLMALVFTAIAGWNSLAILFGQQDMWKKCVAVLVICLMAAALMEPYLFYGHRFYPFFDFLFFLCIGYMTQWRKKKV